MADDPLSRGPGTTVGGGPGTSHPSPVHSPGAARSGSDSDARGGRPATGTNNLPGGTDRHPTDAHGEDTTTFTGAEQGARSAYDAKNVHRALADFPDDELKQIPVLPAGTRLDQGATYFDLHHPEAGEITARGDQDAGADNWFVPKRAVEARLWNRLIGVTNPERRGEASET